MQTFKYLFIYSSNNQEGGWSHGLHGPPWSKLPSIPMNKFVNPIIGCIPWYIPPVLCCNQNSIYTVVGSN